MRRAWLLSMVVAACGGEGPAPAEVETPYSVLERVFHTTFFDRVNREKLLSATASADLRLPGLLDPARYAFLHVAEVRRVNAGRRLGAVDFTIDGWPAALEVELSRVGGRWQVSGVQSPDFQQALLDLLGPEGLASAPSSMPWNGGLAGRDAAGRPSAAVMVLALGGRTWVDSRAVGATEQKAVTSALRVALAARQELARAAHATYRPQVAIALPRNASSLSYALLAEWAMDAGAISLGLVVRATGGGPGYLPLARRGPAPPGVTEPNVLWLRRDSAGLRISVGAHLRTFEMGQVDKQVVGRAVAALRALEPTGAVVAPYAEGDHAGVVALLDACRATAPDMPVAPGAP